MTTLKQMIMIMVVMSVMLTSSAKFSDMKSAFDAAFVRLVADGTYASLSSITDNVTIADCTATPSFYPYPASPTGNLKAVLDRKSVNIGTLEDYGQYFAASSNVPPSGWAVTLLTKIFSMIGANYGVSLLTLNWVYFNSSPDTFTALANGQVDFAAPNFSLGAFFNGSRRNEVFEPTCTLTAGSVSIYVKSGTFQSVSELRATAMNRTLMIGVSGAGSVAEATAFFPTANVNDISLTTSVTSDQTGQYLFDSLRSGMFDLLFDIEPETPAQANGTSRINSGLTSGAGGFFRTREQEAGCSGSSGSSNTININFAGILSGR